MVKPLYLFDALGLIDQSQSKTLSKISAMIRSMQRNNKNKVKILTTDKDQSTCTA